MRMISLVSTLFALATAATLAPARADDAPAARLVKTLTGTWKGPLHLTMGADQADLKAAIACAPIAGKTGIACQASITGVPGLGTMLESDLFGVDPTTGAAHMYAVSNAGDVHDHVGGFEQDALVMRWTGTSPDHHALRETLTFRSTGPRTLAFTQEVTSDGKPFVKLEGTLKK
ncbi:MAG: hypothetical protein K8W52_05650 [Deltaproteobacteria bacterium]|nr:hypothetical protein [Deltaproteobacteria bacterium]